MRKGHETGAKHGSETEHGRGRKPATSCVSGYSSGLDEHASAKGPCHAASLFASTASVEPGRNVAEAFLGTQFLPARPVLE